MSTLERDWGIDPDPDPTPLPARTRRMPTEDDGGWRAAADQYDKWLDAKGER